MNKWNILPWGGAAAVVLGLYGFSLALDKPKQAAEQPLPKPTPAELAAVKQNLIDWAEASTKQAARNLESYRTLSLDGNGRIYINKDRTVTIFQKAATVIPAKFSADDLERLSKNVFHAAANNKDLEPHSAITRALFRETRSYGAEVIMPAGQTSYRLDFHSGRVCAQKPEQRVDCFRLSDVAKGSGLETDINTARDGFASRNGAYTPHPLLRPL